MHNNMTWFYIQTLCIISIDCQPASHLAVAVVLDHGRVGGLVARVERRGVVQEGTAVAGRVAEADVARRALPPVVIWKRWLNVRIYGSLYQDNV
jgi:hypothetical protein